MDVRDKMIQILVWASHSGRRFNPRFINYLITRNCLSPRQKETVDDIYVSFDVERWILQNRTNEEVHIDIEILERTFKNGSKITSFFPKAQKTGHEIS
jgi:hypothetical protein